ncbi:zinc finger MYM-type protein 1-like [Acyrthosiphon pisum]|uniref:TTF-type domain-containing protein n=1 Tax=Acyrthosiphon pisum TaxID=7029 RepID=A0A8R2BA23_ACYPI|nr:zinc finger MYM-type protein 1-like [Acyrthosiphon pisum]|eukprot:XP_008188404.1 PREDICTED: zinc finger MYM-type protein 1-like [Acyrthosiphon pisum]
MSNTKKYLSGSEKRKKKEQERQFTSKLTKIKGFFIASNSEPVTSIIVPSDTLDLVLKTDDQTLVLPHLLPSSSTCTEIEHVTSIVPSDTLDLVLKTDDQTLVLPHLVPSSSSCTAIEKSDLLTDNIADHEEYYKDPFKWPNNLNKKFISFCLDKGPTFFQNMDSNFRQSARIISGTDHTRYISSAVFYRKLSNGEKCNRKWLLYSPSKGSVFCFVCKLFGSLRDNPFVNIGFDKWKKGYRIGEHENSIAHREATTKWLIRTDTTRSVNTELCRQISVETEYWVNILKRVVSVVKFIAARGLPYRGDSEIIGNNNNGNYLGILELISEYDPFLKNHLEKFGNKGKGHPSYISKTIFNEVILLLKTDVIRYITNEIKISKYYSIIMESTQIYQMAIVIRYCTKSDVQERLLELEPIENHTGQSIYDVLEKFLLNVGLNIEDCRGQSDDNASNMSGKFKGLQAHVKCKNDLAVCIPCTAHSLNLVGVHSVDCCVEAVNFFGFLQTLYNFFSSSTHRWKILTDKLDTNDKHRLITLKSLSGTRWSCHSEACKALIGNYEKILEALQKLSENVNENGETKREATILWKKMLKREIAYLTLLWGDILERSNKTSIELQNKHCDALKAVNLLKSLRHFVSSLRDSSEIYENKIIHLSQYIGKTCPPDSDSAVQESIKNCIFTYKNDVDASLENEIIQFQNFLSLSNVSFNESDTFKLLKWFYDKSLQDVFPNILIALRLYLTIPVANCSAERAFSKLTRIKNKYRTSQTQDNLTSLMILHSENDILQLIDFNETLQQFAKEKARKKLKL